MKKAADVDDDDSDDDDSDDDDSDIVSNGHNIYNFVFK